MRMNFFVAILKTFLFMPKLFPHEIVLRLQLFNYSVYVIQLLQDPIILYMFYPFFYVFSQEFMKKLENAFTRVLDMSSHSHPAFTGCIFEVLLQHASSFKIEPSIISRAAIKANVTSLGNRRFHAAIHSSYNVIFTLNV